MPIECGILQEQFVDADAVRILRARLQRRQHHQRHDRGARPVGNLVEMERRPHRQQHDLDRHHRHAAPGHHAEQRQQEAGEDVAVGRRRRASGSPRAPAPCAARRRNRRSSSARNRPSRWRSCRTRRHEPAASRHGRPGCGADRWRSWLRARDRPARRDNGAAAHIRPGWCSRLPARTPNGRPAAGSRAAPASPTRCSSPARRHRRAQRLLIAGRHFAQTSSVRWTAVSSRSGLAAWRATRSAARSPDRTDPSMVAGNPVSVQSPARNRFFQAVTGPGRSAFCSGVASNVARRSRTICQGGNSPCDARGLADIPPDRLRQLLARHIHQPVAIADGDRQPLRKREQPFHQAADHAEDRPARRFGGSKRKCALTMARNFVGVFRPGSSAAAGRGGTASTTASSARPQWCRRRNSVHRHGRRPSRTRAARVRTGSLAPLSCSSLIAGSTSTALSPSRAISGRQACPPASSVSRTIAPARPAEPSGGSTLSAASSSGCTSRWYSVPSQGMASPTSLLGACPDQRHQCQIVAQAGVGDAARLVEHPERQPAVAEIELPALAGREIDERKLRALRPDQPRLGADRARIGQRMAVARQQQMIAVVDGEIGRGVEIGAAAAAGLLRGLVDVHAGNWHSPAARLRKGRKFRRR